MLYLEKIVASFTCHSCRETQPEAVTTAGRTHITHLVLAYASPFLCASYIYAHLMLTEAPVAQVVVLWRDSVMCSKYQLMAEAPPPTHTPFVSLCNYRLMSGSKEKLRVS